MIAINIKNNKSFMAKFLTNDIFDNFYVEEATIETYNTFHIDGHIHKDFFKNDSEPNDNTIGDYSKWSTLKPICFDLIKGKRTPLGFKFTFHPDDKTKSDIVSAADSHINPDDVLLGINIRFSSGSIQITTGTTFKTFSLDKTIEKAWDAFIPSFMSHSDIDFETNE
ncbi:DUF5721 family protein [Butyrivibrio sp. YAB3001]|uniref:DUF5721 family protein n=1 Tax=Butyrivibrio sp. YAB3001 TaxID=1520812 RepID=UPI0008F62D04|nr:DUF5721 family protein [Butyrivibrio sp. YAB3001]SFB72342.1 hypothetical protein SAMN02910398_00443 [Butyrivibrio sp. YAB3001]